MNRWRYLFVVLISLTTVGGLFFYFNCKRRAHRALPIRYIAQTGPVKEALKTEYLGELLGLSSDYPRVVDVVEAQNILKKSPLMKEVNVTLFNAETLYIDYTLRHPCFSLGDVPNALIDEEGALFPCIPFFTPKKLPELWIGFQEPTHWSEVIAREKLDLALCLKKKLEEVVQVIRIDLSQIENDRLSKKEITLILENENKSIHYLRLSVKGYADAISRYLAVKERVVIENCVIDLRLPGLAFLNQLTPNAFMQNPCVGVYGVPQIGGPIKPKPRAFCPCLALRATSSSR